VSIESINIGKVAAFLTGRWFGDYIKAKTIPWRRCEDVSRFHTRAELGVCPRHVVDQPLLQLVIGPLRQFRGHVAGLPFRVEAVEAILLLPEVPLRVELEKVQNFARQLSTQIDDAF